MMIRRPLYQADVEFLQAIIKLATVEPDLTSIDILLGSDYFWSIIEREKDCSSFWIIIIVIKIRIHTYGSN